MKGTDCIDRCTCISNYCIIMVSIATNLYQSLMLKSSTNKWMHNQNAVFKLCLYFCDHFMMRMIDCYFQQQIFHAYSGQCMKSIIQIVQWEINMLKYGEN